jgi:hypothetical protein
MTLPEPGQGTNMIRGCCEWGFRIANKLFSPKSAWRGAERILSLGEDGLTGSKSIWGETPDDADAGHLNRGSR